MLVSKLIIASAIVLTLTSCAEYNSLLSTANTEVTTNAAATKLNMRAADTNKAAIAATTFCTMSVDTLGQNPQWVTAVKELCWTGQKSTASDTATAVIVPTTPAGK
jgi:hypothetical protein